MNSQRNKVRNAGFESIVTRGKLNRKEGQGKGESKDKQTIWHSRNLSAQVVEISRIMRRASSAVPTSIASDDCASFLGVLFMFEPSDGGKL